MYFSPAKFYISPESVPSPFSDESYPIPFTLSLALPQPPPLAYHEDRQFHLSDNAVCDMLGISIEGYVHIHFVSRFTIITLYFYTPTITPYDSAHLLPLPGIIPYFQMWRKSTPSWLMLLKTRPYSSKLVTMSSNSSQLPVPHQTPKPMQVSILYISLISVLLHHYQKICL